jgi:hypothetical protein
MRVRAMSGKPLDVSDKIWVRATDSEVKMQPHVAGGWKSQFALN